MKNISSTSSKLIPGNSSRFDCPPFETEKKIVFNAADIKISQLDEPMYHRQRYVGFVVGPIACNLCREGCTDAFISTVNLDFYKNHGVEITDSPVNLRHLTMFSSPNEDLESICHDIEILSGADSTLVVDPSGNMQFQD